MSKSNSRPLPEGDEVRRLTKTIRPPGEGDRMLTRFQEDVMSQIRQRLEAVNCPAEVSVTIEVNEVENE